MTTDHPAVHYDEWSGSGEVLPAFEPGERSGCRVEPSDETHDGTGEPTSVFECGVLDRRRVQPSLRVEHVLTPCLIEPDGHVVPPFGQGRGARGREPPRSQKP